MKRPLPEPAHCPEHGVSLLNGQPCPDCKAEELDLTPKCQRCGRPLYAFGELAKLAEAALDSLRRRNITTSAVEVLKMVIDSAPCREERCEVKR